MGKRTNVVLDEEKLKQVKKIYDITTTKDLLDFALDELLRAKDRKNILALQGKLKIDLNLSSSRTVR